MAMVQLTVRKVGALRRAAVANGRPTEAEHREILSAALLGTKADFVTCAEKLRRRLRSSVDSTTTIRANRDRDGTA